MTHGRATLLALLSLALAIAAAAQPGAESAGPLLERSGDRVLHRSDIRSRGGRHGELRLVARGSTRVVQTLLYTKLLRRVLAEIRDRERENWPAGAAGSEASERYLAALDSAERAIPIPRIGDRGAAAERRRPLLIEFAVSNSEAAVMLLEPRVSEADGEISIAGARLIERLDLPRDFVQRNMRLIAEEHFAAERDELTWLLAPPDPDAGVGPGSQNPPDGER